MSIEVPYACHVDQKVTTMLCDDPMVPLILHYGSKKFKTDGLVDSGCSVTHANADIAKYFGIVLDSPPCVECETFGISGKNNPIKGYLIDIKIELEADKMPFSGPILFVKNLPYQVLLGQNNFFDYYNVHFKKSKRVFILNRVK